MIRILTFIKFPIPPIQIVFNNGHFVVFFDFIIILLKFFLKLSSQKMQIFSKGFLKNVSTAEEQKPKIERQIDLEGHAKYDNPTPSMKRDIFKK